eukprot:15070086-Alexandrium_andersonii.AAC.1
MATPALAQESPAALAAALAPLSFALGNVRRLGHAKSCRFAALPAGLAGAVGSTLKQSGRLPEPAGG